MNIEEAKEVLKCCMNDDCTKCEYADVFDCVKKHNEAIETVLSELEKKEAIINEMTNFINLMGNELVAETGDNNLEFCKMQKCIDNEELDCEECIKEYFTKKAEKEGIKE